MTGATEVFIVLHISAQLFSLCLNLLSADFVFLDGDDPFPLTPNFSSIIFWTL